MPMFIGSKGILHHQLPQKQTVNDAYYADILKINFRTLFAKTMHGHILHVLMELLTDIGGTPVEYPTTVQELPHVIIFGHFQCLNWSNGGSNFSTDTCEASYCYYSVQDVWKRHTLYA
jgi:hypothetical protein